MRSQWTEIFNKIHCSFDLLCLLIMGFNVRIPIPFLISTFNLFTCPGTVL